MAWPTTRWPTDALTGEFVPEQWSAKVLEHTRSGLVAEQACTTDFQPMMAKGDILHIPVMVELVASDVAVDSDQIFTNISANSDAFGTTATTITIDKWKEVPVILDDSTARQTQVPGLLEKAANNAAYTFKKVVDSEVTALFSTLTSTWAGSDGQTFTDDILIDLMEGLDEADIPPDRSLITDPSGIADMRKIDKFMTFDYSTNPLRLAGYRGMIDAYGLPVFVTNNLTATTTGNYGALVHKECIGLIMQSPMDVERWREGRRHSWLINTSGFYGADVIRSTFGAYFYTRSS